MLEVMILISGGFLWHRLRENLYRRLFDCKPVDRVPVGFWHHFLADQRHTDALADHSAWGDNLAGHDTFYRSWHPDFMKIMTDGFFLYPLHFAGSFIKTDLTKEARLLL